MNTKIIASAGTKDELQKLINKFYCSENWIINNENKVFNTRTDKFAHGVVISIKNNRWRFEMI